MTHMHTYTADVLWKFFAHSSCCTYERFVIIYFFFHEVTNHPYLKLKMYFCVYFSYKAKTKAGHILRHYISVCIHLHIKAIDIFNMYH